MKLFKDITFWTVIAGLVLFAFVNIAMADSALDAPEAQATINTIVVDSYMVRQSYVAGRDEVVIWPVYLAGGEAVQADVIIITNSVIDVKGLHEQTISDFSGFPSAYSVAPATTIIGDLNAKSATYPQTDDLDHLEKVVKQLLGL